MIIKPNHEAEPIVLSGHRAYFMGKNPEGKSVFEIEGGFLLLKNGKVETRKKIDEEGRLLFEEPKKPKKGKEKDGNSD